MIGYCDQAQGSNRAFYQHYRGIGGSNAHFDFPTGGQPRLGLVGRAAGRHVGRAGLDHAGCSRVAHWGGRYLGGSAARVEDGDRGDVAIGGIVGGLSDGVLVERRHDVGPGLPEVETAPAHGQSSAPAPRSGAAGPNPTPWSSPRSSAPTSTRCARPV